jgi:tRNA (guanosine-2'-O-)-methyltransferase
MTPRRKRANAFIPPLLPLQRVICVRTASTASVLPSRNIVLSASMPAAKYGRPVASASSTSTPASSSTAAALANELVDRGCLRQADADLFTGLTDARARKMRDVIESRTRHVTFLLDNLHGVHNLAAVVRSCDAWGIADLHCVLTDKQDASPADAKLKNDIDGKQDGKRFRRHGQSLMELFERESTRRVSKNAHKWINITEHADMNAAVTALKVNGYRICVSSLDPSAKPLADVSLSTPIAFVFGNEHSGVSPELVAAADESFTVPMYGFVEVWTGDILLYLLHMQC